MRRNCAGDGRIFYKLGQFVYGSSGVTQVTRWQQSACGRLYGLSTIELEIRVSDPPEFVTLCRFTGKEFTRSYL